MESVATLPGSIVAKHRFALLARDRVERWSGDAFLVNKELWWLMVTIVAIVLLVNQAATSQQLSLSFVAVPTVFSAYLFGRRRARDQHIQDTSSGVVTILQHYISKDEYTQNHSHRVSIYAAKIASRLGLSCRRIDDLRTAALLHDIGKLEISRDILYKATQLTDEEYEEIQSHVQRGVDLLRPVGGSLRRILPIVLAHHDHFDGSGYHPQKGEQIPLESRILSVADAYDAITSDRPYKKAMPAIEARDMIVRNAGTQFDPAVVLAFQKAFDRGELDVPQSIN